MLVIQENKPSSDPEMILADVPGEVNLKEDDVNTLRTDSRIASLAFGLERLELKFRY